MPKNKGKGGKNRRRGKNDTQEEKRDLLLKGPGQGKIGIKIEYAQITAMLGNGRVETYCFADGQKRIARIVGSMRKKTWIIINDVVLLGLRDYQADRADVIAKYTIEEARELKDRKEIPSNEATQTNEHIEDGNIEFREFSEDERKDSVDSLDMPETVDDKFIEDL